MASESGAVAADQGGGHKWAVRGLLCVAFICAVLGITAVWVERQALETDAWVDTSGKLLQNTDINEPLGDYLVDELFTSVDIQAKLAAKLPPLAQPLAGPITGALRNVAGDAANKALNSAQVQQLWENANRAAHEELLKLINNEGEFIDTSDGVVLELKPLVAQLATEIGLSASVADKLPDSVATLQIADGENIDKVRKITKLLQGLAALFSLLALGLIALAIFLARGHRSRTIIFSGLTLIGAAVLVIAIRHFAGGIVVNSLGDTEVAERATAATFSIGTSLLLSIAKTVIVFGVLFVLAGWLGSPAGSGRAMRGALAPSLREHPVPFYVLVLLAALFWLAISPAEGLRPLLITLVLAVMAVIGVAALRSQAASEFPDASNEDTLGRARDKIGAMFASVGLLRHGDGGPAAGPAADPEEVRLQRLERLARLREQGLLDDDEVAAEKARVLAPVGAASAQTEAPTAALDPAADEPGDDEPPADPA